MECQSLFSEKNKEYIVNLSSAESAQRLVKVKFPVENPDSICMYRDVM